MGSFKPTMGKQSKLNKKTQNQQAVIKSALEKSSKGNAQYKDVPGTKIKLVGSEYVRIANASGKTFHPNDVEGVCAHLEKFGGGSPAAIVETGQYKNVQMYE